MAQTINTNVASLNAQRNLSTSQGSLATSLQRLSSGLRINSAKDDAAGLSISDRMNSQIRGLNQAVRNANDGVSMAQTAESALQSSGEILQRIRELAVQSSNSTNTASDREALQKEVGQLTSELDRIATTAQFNGQNILDGSMGTATFQVGANANQVIQTAGANFRTSNYGNFSTTNDQAAVGASTKVATSQAITIAGSAGSAAYTTKATDTAKTIAAGINALTEKTGVTATATTTANLALGNETYALDIKSDNSTAVTVTFSVSDASTQDGLANAISAINSQTSKTGVTAEYDKTNGGIKLTNATGNDITLTNKAASANTKLDIASYAAAGTLTSSYDAKASNAVGVVNGTLSFDSQQSFAVTDAGSGLDLTKASTLQSVSTVDVTSFANAQKALKIIDSSLAAINGQRANYGALQSRFETTISNLQAQSENLSASRGRIVDADFATETANLTRSQILQQAGTAMLAQANGLPQNVLSLLRG